MEDRRMQITEVDIAFVRPKDGDLIAFASVVRGSRGKS
jgi:hypothetical protein